MRNVSVFFICKSNYIKKKKKKEFVIAHSSGSECPNTKMNQFSAKYFFQKTSHLPEIKCYFIKTNGVLKIKQKFYCHTEYNVNINISLFS